MSLYDLEINEKGIIKEIKCNDKLKKRLFCLGLIENTIIIKKGVAPFGDPLLFEIRGFKLAIRTKDAKNIIINKKI